MDLGCGDGAWSVAAARSTGRRVVAVDSRAGAAAAARAAGRGKELEALVARAEATGLPASSAAAVLCVRLLGRVADPGLVLAEAARLLTPGGVLVVADWRGVARPEGACWEALPPPPGGWAMLARCA